MVTAWLKLKAAGAWTAKNWKLFLFPIGILIWIVGRAGSRKTVVLQSTELEDHFELKTKLDKETIEQRKMITAAHEEVVRTTNVEADEKIKKSQEEAVARAKALQEDPDALTAYLKEVGQKARTPVKIPRPSPRPKL